jgi:hypothetical protein
MLAGKSAIWRATIQVLKINLDHRVGFRLELIEEGDFPPEFDTSSRSRSETWGGDF